jgi:hypothetical protein
VRDRGLLVPGFSKRFEDDEGTTCFLGVPIGRFTVVTLERGQTELRYRRWPVVDVLSEPPVGTGSIAARGFIRLPPGGRRVRFCDFRLERQSSD